MSKIFSLPKGRALCYTLIASAVCGLTSCSSDIESLDFSSEFSRGEIL